MKCIVRAGSVSDGTKTVAHASGSESGPFELVFGEGKAFRMKPFRDPAAPLSKNAHLLRWVEKMARLTQPAAIHWVDGSQEEYDALCAQMVEGGSFIKLNEELWPGCYLRALRPERRRAGRRPHLHLLATRRRRPAPPTTGKTPSRCGAS